METDFVIVVPDRDGEGTRSGFVHVLASLFLDAEVLVVLHGENRKDLAAAALHLPRGVQPLINTGSRDTAITAGYRAVLATRPGVDVVRIDPVGHPLDAVRLVRSCLKEHDFVVVDAGDEGKDRTRALAHLKEVSGGRLVLERGYEFQGISGRALSGLLTSAGGEGVDGRMLVETLRRDRFPHVITGVAEAPKPAAREARRRADTVAENAVPVPAEEVAPEEVAPEAEVPALPEDWEVPPPAEEPGPSTEETSLEAVERNVREYVPSLF